MTLNAKAAPADKTGMPRIHPVWWLNAAMYAAGALLLVTVVRGHPPIESPHLPWFVIALAIAACELRPVA